MVKPIDAAGNLVYDILAVLDQVDVLSEAEAAQSLQFTNSRLRVEEAYHAINLVMPKTMRLAGESPLATAGTIVDLNSPFWHLPSPPRRP